MQSVGSFQSSYWTNYPFRSPVVHTSTCLVLSWRTPRSRVLIEKPAVAQLVKKFPAFQMETEISLPSSQNLSVCVCPEPNQSSPRPHIFSKTCVGITIPSTIISSKLSLSFRFLYQNSVCFSPLPLYVILTSAFRCLKWSLSKMFPHQMLFHRPFYPLTIWPACPANRNRVFTIRSRSVPAHSYSLPAVPICFIMLKKKYLREHLNFFFLLLFFAVTGKSVTAL